MGSPMGSFNIPSDKKSELIDLLVENNCKCSLIERPPENRLSSIKIDLDFRFNLHDTARHITDNHIVDVISLYNKIILDVLDVSQDKLNSFVFQRNKPYTYRGNCKDGIHIMYPDIICHADVQYLIRDKVLLCIEPIIKSIGFINSIDDVVDKSIISSNGWFVYGCSKPVIADDPYHLTSIYDGSMNMVDNFELEGTELIKYLSIRDHTEAETTKPKVAIIKSDTPKPKPKPKLVIRNPNVPTNVQTNVPTNQSDTRKHIPDTEKLIAFRNKKREHVNKCRLFVKDRNEQASRRQLCMR
jgi:hypothetical protein